jgi:membrane-associated phospholipid phosphatase
VKSAAWCTFLFAVTVGLLAFPQGAALDRLAVVEAVDLAHQHPWLHACMELGTSLGNKATICGALLVPAAFGGEAARGTVRLVIPSVVSNQAATSAVKWLTNRPRPDGGHKRRANTSFPSGHASAAAGLAWIVSHRHRRLAPWIWILALWIASSRIFLGRHYPSDVTAGALLGILFALATIRFEARLAPRNLDRPVSSGPARSAVE